MKKSLFIIALGAFALTSCSQDEVLDVQKDAVQFSVVADKASRGAVTTTATIKDFKVTAFNANVDGVNTTTFMSGVDVTKSGDNWGYGSTKFWPTSGAINFYSYSPANLAENSFATIKMEATSTVVVEGANVTTNKGGQTLTYVAPTDCSEQVDVLYALNTGLSKKDGEVKVNFRHALSQIVFRAKNVKTDLEVDVIGVRVVNLKNSGVFTWPTTSTNDPDYSDDPSVEGQVGEETQTNNSWGSWALGDSYKTYPAALAFAEGKSSTVLTSDPVVLTDQANPLLVLPQDNIVPATVNDGGYMELNAGQTYFAVKCKIYNIDNSGTPDDTTDDVKTLLWPNADGYAEVVIPTTSPDTDANGNYIWKQGKKYIYTFVFGEGAGYVGPNGDNPEDDPKQNGTDPVGDKDDPSNPADPNEPGEPVLVPVTFTVTVDEFQNAQYSGVDMKTTGNAVTGTTPQP